MTRSATELPKNTTERTDPECQRRDHQPAQEQRKSDVVAHCPLTTAYVHH
jgi:hypothetical protein